MIAWIIYIIFLIAAIILYPEPYKFWDYYLSDLGVEFSPNGYPNPYSFISIFIAQFFMIVTGCSLYILLINYYWIKGLSKKHSIAPILTIIGYLLLPAVFTFPKDTFPLVHAGFAFTSFGLGFFSSFAVYASLRHNGIKSKKFTVSFLTYVVICIFYAFIPFIFTIFRDIYPSFLQTLQKFVVFSLFYNLYLLRQILRELYSKI
jgi:hypothetical membrane protein